MIISWSDKINLAETKPHLDKTRLKGYDYIVTTKLSVSRNGHVIVRQNGIIQWWNNDETKSSHETNAKYGIIKIK